MDTLGGGNNLTQLGAPEFVFGRYLCHDGVLWADAGSFWWVYINANIIFAMTEYNLSRIHKPSAFSRCELVCPLTEY
jgi:hypothetical protein